MIRLKLQAKKIEREKKQQNSLATSNKLKIKDLNDNSTNVGAIDELDSSEDDFNVDIVQEDEFIELSDTEIFDLFEEEQIETVNDLVRIEAKYKFVKPEVKEYISKRIERGNFADKIKKINNYKCLVCEQLNKSPYVFKKNNGDYYVEVHHIIPVAELQIGSLSTANLITVCPNHHRQIHYGKFEIVENNDLVFIFRIDNQLVHIKKSKIA